MTKYSHGEVEIEQLLGQSLLARRISFSQKVIRYSNSMSAVELVMSEADFDLNVGVKRWC